MFRITSDTGFHIGFDNGYTVSVQFGEGNYCEHYRGLPVLRQQRVGPVRESYDAEIAVFDAGGNLVPLVHDSVHGYCRAEVVALVLAAVSKGDLGAARAALAET